MHVDHEFLRDYDPRRIWHDGCAECELRGRTVPASIGSLDDHTLCVAINRARQWRDGDVALVAKASSCEINLFEFLIGTMQVVRRLRYMGYRTEDLK